VQLKSGLIRVMAFGERGPIRGGLLKSGLIRVMAFGKRSPIREGLLKQQMH
jgi:hypothetical protein